MSSDVERARKRENRRRYVAAHPERILVEKRIYRERHRDRLNKQQREKYAADLMRNRKKLKLRMRKHRAKIKNENR